MTEKFDYLNAPEKFFSAFPDPDVFEFEGDNLSKLFLDEFFSRQFAKSIPAWTPQRSNRSLRGLITNIFRLIRGLALLASGLFSTARKKTYIFFGSNGRTITKDGATYDIFNHKIINTLGKENCLIFEPIDGGQKKVFQPDFFLHDFVMVRLVHQWLVRNRVKQFVGNLLRSAQSPILTEREATQILSKFLSNRWIISIILITFKIKKALVICHYGKEAFTSACKNLGIPVIELMHGLIFPSDPNYCYANLSPNYRKSLRSSQLPDRLEVFGSLWKEVLSGVSYFNPEEIFEAGYYLESSIFDGAIRSPGFLTEKMGSKTKQKKILFTTQPIYQEEIILYIKFLKRKLDRNKWLIIIKPHPAEKSGVYDGEAETGFLEISQASVYSLLPEVHFHISVTSSVIFEAIYYPISNYVLYIPWEKEFCDEILATGAARKLKQDELPVAYPVDSNLRKRVFSNFDETALQNAWIQKHTIR
ncbi:MAG: hypothetical protein AB9891_14955 [Anaerolineaceae bacterium]